MLEPRPLLHGTYPIVTSSWPWIVAVAFFHTLWYSTYDMWHFQIDIPGIPNLVSLNFGHDYNTFKVFKYLFKYLSVNRQLFKC